jgi:hypothetical protein
MPFLTAPPDMVFVRIQFFDGSERTILHGEEVQETLKGLVATHQTAGYKLKVPLRGRLGIKEIVGAEVV